MAVLPVLFFGFAFLSLGCATYVAILSLRDRRVSSLAQVSRLLLTVAALVAMGMVSRLIAVDWVAVVFGAVSGLMVAWWYGRNTIRHASLGVNVSLIVFVASLMTLSIAIPEWLDPRSFLIAGSLLGIRLLVATAPKARVEVPSRRRGDRAIRIATVWMFLFASAAAFTLAAGGATARGVALSAVLV